MQPQAVASNAGNCGSWFGTDVAGCARPEADSRSRFNSRGQIRQVPSKAQLVKLPLRPPRQHCGDPHDKISLPHSCLSAQAASRTLPYSTHTAGACETAHPCCLLLICFAGHRIDPPSRTNPRGMFRPQVWDGLHFHGPLQCGIVISAVAFFAARLV